MRVTAVLLIAVACVGALASGPTGPLESPSAGAQLDRPPAFRDDQNELLTLDRPDTLYLLDFVAVGCKPCALELPELARLARDLDGTGRFQLIPIVYGWSGKALSRPDIVETLNSGTLLLYGDTEKWADKLHVSAYPTKFLIRDARILKRVRGGSAGAYERWRAIVERELKAPGSN